MFGSLQPKSLSGCARGRYQSSFCGSCHAMAELGRPWALATGYDIAFLHLIMAELQEAPVERLACTALPFRKLPVRRLQADSRRWLAAVNVLLIEAKCRDDASDEGGLKGRLGLRVVKNQAARARTALAESGFPHVSISTLAERQQRLEEQMLSLEQYALPTGSLLGEIFEHAAKLSGRAEWATAMRRLGQGLGSAIYIKDALDDFDKDCKRSRFNAIAAGGHNFFYARTALDREVERARNGLLEMGLGTSEAASVLQELRPSSEPPRAPRKRRKLAGYCDCIACCDCGVCLDAGLCTDCWGSGGFCPCECCGSCGSSGSDSHLSSSAAGATTAHKATPPVLLHCPSCGSNLHPCQLGRVEVDECTGCNGLWLDHGELEELAGLKQLPPRLLTIQKTRAIQVRPEGTRPCPRCSKLLLGTLVKGVRLDICPDCQGLWLDQGELNQLLED
ncbi:MAG: DUF5685 family protein [Vulcanimicrobiota bacterium]